MKNYRFFILVNLPAIRSFGRDDWQDDTNDTKNGCEDEEWQSSHDFKIQLSTRNKF